MIISSNIDSAPRVVEVLIKILRRAGTIPVAWPGRWGELFYSSADHKYQPLERLAQTCASTSELISSALGWYTCALLQGFKEPLTLILEPPLTGSTLDVLETVSARKPNLLIILLDVKNTYSYRSWSPFNKQSRRSLHNLAPLLERLDIDYIGSHHNLNQEKLSRELSSALTSKSHPRLFHLTGIPEDRKSAEITRAKRIDQFYLAAPPVHPASTDPVAAPKPRSSHTLVEHVLMYIADEHPQNDKLLTFWCKADAPYAMRTLQDRLIRLDFKQALGEARGAALGGYYPRIIVSVRDLSHGLGCLMDGLDFPVTLIVTEGGITTPLHPSGLYDLALLRCVPGLIIAAPSDEEEATTLVGAATTWEHPVAIRFTSSPAVGVTHTPPSSVQDPGRSSRLREGGDLAIIALGSTVFPSVLAAETLNGWGVKASVFDCRYLRPIDEEMIIEAAACQKILTAEEHALHGGLATTILEALHQAGLSSIPLYSLAVAETGIEPGEYSMENFGLHSEGIARTALEFVTDNNIARKSGRHQEI